MLGVKRKRPDLAPINACPLVEAKNKEMARIRFRAAGRIEELINAANKIILMRGTALLKQETALTKPFEFQMDDESKRQIIHRLEDVVRSWGGGNGVKRSTLLRKSKEQIYGAVRNFWNHRKAEKMGDYLFYTVFSQIFQVTHSNEQLSSV